MVRMITRVFACVMVLLLSLTACAAPTTPISVTETIYTVDTVPAFNGNPYVAINGNEPIFAEAELVTEGYERYAPLDVLGRCGEAMACVGPETMPTEERGSIGSVKPSGWQTVKYDNIDGKYLYNRCHLIGYQLTGENANVENLITGTRYLNMEGMLPFENMIADYVKETGNHVLYRVIPLFDGVNLVARGVHMQAISVEDDGAGVSFNVYAYNAQPGIEIDYLNGNSVKVGGQSSTTVAATTVVSQRQYVLNTSSKKVHLPECSSVASMSAANKRVVNETKEALLAQGYELCKSCNP